VLQREFEGETFQTTRLHARDSCHYVIIDKPLQMKEIMERLAAKLSGKVLKMGLGNRKV